MTAYLLRRFGVSVLLLWAVLTVTFVAIELAPGDPASRWFDPRIPRAQLDHIRHLYGLDRPLLERYASWLEAFVLEGEWGLSFLEQRPVRDVIVERIGPTALLGGASLVFAFVAGSLLGVALARRAGGGLDALLRVLTLAVYAVPSFWLGIMLLLLLSVWIPLLPPGGMTSPLGPPEGPLGPFRDVLTHLALPALTLGLPLCAVIARLVRNGLLDELAKDYTRAGRARGLRERTLLAAALRNSLAPLIQMFGLWLPVLFGGAVAVEIVFTWPGLGSAAAAAISARDFPLVLAITLLSCAGVILGNVISDVLQATVDPRVILR